MWYIKMSKKLFISCHCIFLQSAVNEQHYEEASRLYREAMELAKSEPEESYGKTITLEIVDQVFKDFSCHI